MQSISRSKTDPRGNVCTLSVRVAHVLRLLSPYAVRYSTLNSTLPWDSLPPAKLLCDSVITSIRRFSIDETSFDKHNRFSLNTSPVHGKNSVSVYLASHRAKNCNIICVQWRYDDFIVHCFEKNHAPSTYSNLYAHCTIPGGSAGKQLGDERLPSIIGWSCFFSIWIITLSQYYVGWDSAVFFLSFFFFVKKKQFESFGLALRLRPTDFRHISWPWMFLGHKWLLMAMFRLKTRPENIPNTRDSEFCKLDWICWMLSCITIFKAAFFDLLWYLVFAGGYLPGFLGASFSQSHVTWDAGLMVRWSLLGGWIFFWFME